MKEAAVSRPGYQGRWAIEQMVVTETPEPCELTMVQYIVAMWKDERGQLCFWVVCLLQKSTFLSGRNPGFSGGKSVRFSDRMSGLRPRPLLELTSLP